MQIKSESRRNDAYVCFLFLISLATYANTLLNGFIYDDNSVILDNPYVHSLRHLREIFTTPFWSFQGAEGIANYYRPLVTFGYLICWQISGPVPLLYHICNVILNAGVVLLVYFVARRLFEDDVLSLIAAAIFALHPVHTQSVAWVADVADLELTFFYLLAFWVFLDLARVSGGGLWARRILMGVSFCLALMSKEQAATLPLLATLYEHFYRGDRKRTSLREKGARYGMLWVLTGAYIVLRSHFVGGVLSSKQRTGVSFYEMILSAVALVGQYAGKLVWPAHLALFHDFYKSTSLLQSGVILGCIALLACVLLFVWIGMQRPASFAVIWMLVTLAPVLNIRWMTTNVFAERYVYLPSVGFCWLAAYGARKLWASLELRPSIWRGTLATFMCAAAVLCAVTIIRQDAIWHDQETFIRQTLAASPDEVIRVNLGAIDWNRGDLQGAEREWDEALKLHPDNGNLLENFALLRAKQKRYPEAIDLFRRAIEQMPLATDAYLKFGELYEELVRDGDAEIQYRAAVNISPLNIRARNHLGALLFKENRMAEAEQQFQQSIESDHTGVAYAALGDIYSSWGNKSKAEESYAEATSLEPFDAHSHFSLGGLYEGRGQVEKAAREYQAGLQMDPSNIEARAALRRLVP